jgi:aquaporin Z
MALLRTLRDHWVEYLIEAAGLATFMVSAGVFATLLEHPGSSLNASLPDPTVRRALMGLAMGATAISIVYSPWGQRSGAHINPALTLAYLRLGKIAPADALCYVLAQFGGAVAGTFAAWRLLGAPFADAPVRYVATLPGPEGPAVAFAAELVLSFGLMTLVLVLTNHGRLARYTGLFVGGLVALYIVAEAPLSGMSMNPARTFGPSLFARLWDALPIYLVAPPLGMLAAAEVYVRLRGARAVHCAKLDHSPSQRCIFRCGYAATQTTTAALPHA